MTVALRFSVFEGESEREYLWTEAVGICSTITVYLHLIIFMAVKEKPEQSVFLSDCNYFSETVSKPYKWK